MGVACVENASHDDLSARTCKEQRSIMDALALSNAAYEPSLTGAMSYLECAIQGGVELIHHQGIDQIGSASSNQALLCCRVRETAQILVSCRGTSSLCDVVQDLKLLPARLTYHDAAAHWGFAERAEGIPLDPYANLIDSGERITFTGHSLGGAVASLLALRMLRELDREEGEFAENREDFCQEEQGKETRIKCITFGAPLFASSHLAELITARYSAVYLHVVQRGDCVPNLIPFLSTIKRLFSDDDHWEGFRVARRALGSLLPTLGSSIVSAIPAPIGFLLRSALRLAVIPRSLSYGFAGQVLTVDASSRSFWVSGSDRLNAWHSQLVMAISAARDAVKNSHHHSLLSYKMAMDFTISSSCSCQRFQKHDRSWLGFAVASSIASAANAFHEHCVCKKLHAPREQKRHRRFQRLGWLLGFIGRISRHLRAIQTMCLYTLVNTALSSLVYRSLLVSRLQFLAL
ncbi:hypothetical protein SELMODRAFT_404357 [Selaginella moellendorffii]|uniref:Fungal lipase-type domain-containing protein n=1 Tax=Selaginella moellendorffii TaxID=88036 RepID=D8QV29_SELML|nr:hypothetical protein SELMODRAFT_404357 [Selaginella moellendorffii]